MKLFPERAMRESHQGKRSAFAVIIGAEQDDHVFHRDDEEQRPDDEREDAEDRLPSGRCIVASRRQYRLAKGIKRARADVTEDDAHARKRRRCPSARRPRLGHGADVCGCTHEERSVAPYQSIPQARATEE